MIAVDDPGRAFLAGLTDAELLTLYKSIEGNPSREVVAALAWLLCTSRNDGRLKDVSVPSK